MPVYYDKKRKSYFISTSYTVRHGTYKKKTIRGFQSKKDAEAYDELLKAKLQKNTSTVLMELLGINNGTNTSIQAIGKELKISNLLAEWYIESKKSNLAYSTYYNRKKFFEKSIIPFFNDKDIRKIKAAEITEWLDQLASEKLSITTIREYFSKLSQLYSYANRVYEINYDPTKSVKPPKLRDAKIKEKVIWNWEQFQSFIHEVDDSKYFTLFWLLWQTGLRIGELRGLKWYDFKRRTKELFIERQITDANSSEGELKSRNSYRTYYLDDYTVKYLNDFYESEAGRENFSMDEYIFGNCHTPIGRGEIEKHLDLYISRANKKRQRKLPAKFTPHCFRHSLVSILFAQGYTEIDIGKLIGDNPLTVRKTYAHFIPSTRQEMVNYYHEMNEKIMNFEQK